jgi:hypothetical protein
MTHVEHLFMPDDRCYGLELQLPFSELLLNGKKTIETRSYELPRKLLYKHILIIESDPGKDGVSALGSWCRNTVGLTADEAAAMQMNDQAGARILGSVVFSECFEYACEEDWRSDVDKHLVPAGSAYDWPPSGVSRSAAIARKSTDVRDRDRKHSPAPSVSPKRATHQQSQKKESAEDEDARYESLLKARKERQVEAAADNVLQAITIASGAQSPAQYLHASRAGLSPNRGAALSATAPAHSSTRSPERRRGGALVEQNPEAVPHSPFSAHPSKASRDRRFGWKVLGVFRSPVPASLIPHMMRVHRSLYDCGSAQIALPSC